MIVTLKTKVIWKQQATEKTTLEKPVMVPINLRVDRHKVDQSKIFKLTPIQILKFNMINSVMLSIKIIKIDFKTTLINSRINSSNNRNRQSIPLMKIITHK